jgi:hypothetical protein
MSAVFAPLTRGEASGGFASGGFALQKTTPPLAFGSRPPYQGVKANP